MNAIDFNYQRLVTNIEEFIDTQDRVPILLMSSDTCKILNFKRLISYGYDFRIAINDSLPLGEVELVSWDIS